jgi:predicted ester cyclase
MKLSPVQTVQLYIDCMKAHDLDRIRSLSLAGCEIHFTESHMSLRDYLEDYELLVQSFPDLDFEAKGLRKVLGSKNEIEFPFFQAKGTHTGKAYGFGPYPEVPTSGLKVKNDPERAIFE